MLLKKKSKKRSRRAKLQPSLRFNPYAWAKLLYLRDRGDTEIGGFGLSAVDDPLLIVDVLTMTQRCSVVTVAFDDSAVADLFDDLVDRGLQPDQFSRIWLHTHPGSSPLPSSTDEATFRRVFGKQDWSVMAIVAANDATYARLSFGVGPGGSFEIPMQVDYRHIFEGAAFDAWDDEYRRHVIVETLPTLKTGERWDDRYWEESQLLYQDWEDFYDGAEYAGSF
jgi:proteasome lid subunit RPN8/RPN11